MITQLYSNALVSIYRATEAIQDRGLIVVKNPKSDNSEPPKNFTFDHVFDENVHQKYIYDTCAAQVVEACLLGFNGTIFACKAYLFEHFENMKGKVLFLSFLLTDGQTGSGKTHTMEGKPDPPHLRGIIPNSFQHIFEYVLSATSNQHYLVRVISMS